MLNLVKELCALSGVASFEESVQDFIQARVAPYADEMRVDTLGNLIVWKRGRKATGKRFVMCAHMDEVGLMVRHITSEGYLKVTTIGGIDTRVLIGKPVKVGPQEVPGVIGLKAYHLVSDEEEKRVPKLEDLYVDIGAGSQKEAEALVSLGDVVVFDSDCVEFGNGMLKAKALDDRVGCAVMMKLLEEELPMDTTFVFTVQEEVGCRGAFGAAFAIHPEIALALEGTTAADLPGSKGAQKVCMVGKGPVIPFMDMGSVGDRELYRLLRDTAEQNGIPWQTKHYLAGATDASSFQRTREGVRTATLSSPVRYLHAPASVVAIQDLENQLKLARLFLGALAERM